MFHRTLLAIHSDDTELISKTLLHNYGELPKIESKNFREATERLENHYFFLKYIDEYEVELPELATNSELQSIMQRLTQSTDDKFRALGDVRGILRIINDRLLSLAFYSDHNAELHSVPRNYIAFLNEQKRLYEPHIADILTTTASSTRKTIKAKKKLSKSTNTKIKTALKLIDFLSGENNDGKPIMSPDDYSKLQGYIKYFYENNALPKVEKPLWTDTDAQTVSYTIYLCKVSNDPGRDKEKTLLYATFVHDVFYKFKDTEIETIYRKFSTKPTHYDDIVKSK